MNTLIHTIPMSIDQQRDRGIQSTRCGARVAEETNPEAAGGQTSEGEQGSG